MEARCSVLGRTVLSVAELTMESADMALMPSWVVVRVDTWLETVHRIEVRLEVMNAQPRPIPHSAAAAEPPKRNKLYALKEREEQEMSADMVTGMLQVFTTSVYALLDPGFTLSVGPLLLAFTF